LVKPKGGSDHDDDDDEDDRNLLFEFLPHGIGGDKCFGAEISNGGGGNATSP
jgi:hypothetical protein